jgi:hypothetical protein
VCLLGLGIDDNVRRQLMSGFWPVGGNNAYANRNWTGGVNTGFSPVYNQQFNSLGPFNNHTYSPVFNQRYDNYSGDNYSYAPTYNRDFVNHHNTNFDFAPTINDRYINAPTYSASYRPTYNYGFGQQAPQFGGALYQPNINNYGNILGGGGGWGNNYGGGWNNNAGGGWNNNIGGGWNNNAGGGFAPAFLGGGNGGWLP